MENSDIENQMPDAELDAALPPDSYQNLPSILLRDLSRKNARNQPVLEFTDIAVYALLKAHSRIKGKCHPSHSRLATLAGCSPETINRSLRRLDDAGHIQRKSHCKGQIILLTDVMRDGKINRRSRISFPPKPPKPCLMTTTDIQVPVTLATAPSRDTELDGEPVADGDMPF